MAGKKQFEEGKALDMALVAFWHSGYEATSYVDLEAATGLKKSSLYNAFGGKSDLYEKCLARFEETYNQPLLRQLHQNGLHRVLTAYFESLFEHFADTGVPCGSLATMQALTSGTKAKAANRVASQMNRLQDLLKARFERALHEGELPQDTDTDALTSLFLVLSRGLAVLHHDDEDIRILRHALTGALAVLAAPPRK